MEAPALSLSLQAQSLSIPQTPVFPAIKTHLPHLSSPPAHCHPPRSRGIQTLRSLALAQTTYFIDTTVPISRLRRRDVIPPLETRAQEPQAVIRTKVPA